MASSLYPSELATQCAVCIERKTTVTRDKWRKVEIFRPACAWAAALHTAPCFRASAIRRSWDGAFPFVCVCGFPGFREGVKA